jgi:hypothetical protein
LTLEDLARIVIDAQSSATTPEATTMQLLLIGKDPESNPTGSPTVYRTDRMIQFFRQEGRDLGNG